MLASVDMLPRFTQFIHYFISFFVLPDGVNILFPGISNVLYSLISDVELVPSNWRVHSAMLTMYGWVAGYMILAGLAYFVRDWFKLQLLTAVPSMLLLMTMWLEILTCCCQGTHNHRP